MKKAILLALCVSAVALGARAQEMNVIRLDGQVDEFDLAEIDSVTFSMIGAKSGVGLRGASDVLRIHTRGGVFQFLVTEIDSVCFVDEALMNIFHGPGGPSQFDLAEVDSMTFASSAEHLVSITYNGTTVTVDNPLEGAGVAVDVAGADVTVIATAGIAGIVYVLSGATADGMCKVYSDSDLTLRLDGVEIANQDGPAINVQADETISVELVDGTTSTLADGVTYAAPPGEEDQKAAFFSEGQLIFSGAGSLVVQGQGDDQHGLGSDDFVEVHGGSIVVQSAVKDGIHTNEGYYQTGGSVAVAASGSDGVDAGDGPVEIAGGTLTVLNQDDDRDALKCDGEIWIAGGEVDLTVEGDQSKGLNAWDVLLTGGTVTIHTSGGAVLEASGAGYDPSYCAAVKADSLVRLDGCQVTINTVGTAGRGISSDGDIEILSGGLGVTSSGGGGVYTNEEGEPDAYHGPCLNADGDVTLSGGTVTLSHSGSGGKGIAGDGDLSIGTALSSPTLQVTTTGPPIQVGYHDNAEAKAISVDSLVTIANGTLTISAADDAIKSKTWIEINGGLIDIVDSLEGIESPNLFINGGEIHLTSHDDGLNATQGDDVEYNDGSVLTINGGYVHLNAPAGDGMDSNGNLTINGGTVIVHGPPNQPEVGLDVNGTFLVNGGFLVVAQINTNMVEVPSNASDQRSVHLRSYQIVSAGILFHIEDTSGNDLVTFRPERRYSSILLSTPDLISGTTYRVYVGGSSTGAEQDGLYTGGVYTPGVLETDFTSTGTVQTVTF
ncbi:MAG: carbohydrate-binding domain-containing protein [Candidatus Krumholzibacteriota bacterium]|nr:carbohydrate-binding domain-containing protein [Candidatus Krumholzibacteriota bacterium]